MYWPNVTDSGNTRTGMAKMSAEPRSEVSTSQTSGKIVSRIVPSRTA
jgi:hypothetical protein